VREVAPVGTNGRRAAAVSVASRRLQHRGWPPIRASAS